MAGTSTQALQHFQTTPLSVLEEEIRRGERDADLRAVFGDALASEMQQMVATGGPAVLGGEERPLVVLLPGIMGSTLFNTRGDVGLIWVNPLAFAAGKLQLLKLAPSGDADAGPVAIVPSGLIATTYLPMQLHLKYLGGCDVFMFPFDWRRSPTASVDALHTFLQRLHTQNNGSPIYLVCHSMGGLVARSYCMRYSDEARAIIAHVVMLGTPNYGSCEAVRNITLGGDLVQLVQRLNPHNDPLGVARSAPGLYAMMPAPQHTYPQNARFPYPFVTEFNVYDAPAYQIDTISPAHLASARQGYEGLTGEPLDVPVTVIAGFDLPTCVGVVKTATADDKVSFDFTTHTTIEGDGTVPVASATAIPGARNFFVRQGKHGDLPLYSNVRRAVTQLVHDQVPDLPETMVPMVLGEEDALVTKEVPEAPLPGTLNPAELDAIAERIRTGTATPEDLSALSKLC